VVFTKAPVGFASEPGVFVGCCGFVTVTLILSPTVTGHVLAGAAWKKDFGPMSVSGDNTVPSPFCTPGSGDGKPTSSDIVLSVQSEM
jgi:hypothetical protein